MLVWFCIRAKLRAHTLRHPCLFMNALLALRPCKAFGRSFQASLPCSLLPLHLILPSPTTIAKGQQPLSPHQHSCLLMNALLVLHPHYPLLCTTTLASLVKGRWIDGKAQALILLLSACDMPTIFMLQTFCRQDGGIAQQPLAPHNLPKSHYPTLSTTFLPPLLKVRCCRPKKFGRLPEGLSLHQPFQNRTIPLAFRTAIVYMH